MSRKCEVCGKKPSTGNNVSHANNKTKRRWVPNLQPVRIIKNKTIQRIVVCTSCIHSGKIQKAPFDHSGAKGRRQTSAAGS